MQQLDLFGFPIETPAPKKKEKAPRASEASTSPAQTKTVAAPPVETRPSTNTIMPPPANAIYAKEEIAPEEAKTEFPQQEESITSGAAPRPVMEEAVAPVTETPAQEEEAVQQPVLPAANIEAVNAAPAAESIPTETPAAEPASYVAPKEETVAPAMVVATTVHPHSGENKGSKTAPAKTAAPVKTGKRGRKSFKEMDSEADLVEVPDDETLQKKLYYSISEVAGWFKVNTSLLRYWENEFDVLQPRKTRKGDRLFRVEDIKNLQLIYFLLRQRKFSIDGAKNYLKNNRQEADTQIKLVESLTKFRSFLLEMKATLQA